MTPTPIEARVSAAHSEEACATEPIHSNTLSKHTHASPAAPNLSQRGGNGAAGRPTQQAQHPALPSHHLRHARGRRIRERKWPAQALRERNAKPFLGQASHIVFRVFKCQRKKQVAGDSQSCCHNGITYGFLHTITEDQSFPHALEL